MIVTVILFLFLLLLFYILSMVWPPDSPWAPWWRTNKEVARAICRLAKIGENDVVYDLGCGDGTALLVANREFGAKGVGVEIDPLRFVIARMRAIAQDSSKDVQFIRGNFFNQNISSATVVVVYLVPRALNKLLPKFKRELKKGTRIVSYRYKISLPLKKHDVKNNLRLYVV